MTYDEVIQISGEHLLPAVFEMYALNGYQIVPLASHEGGRNVIYTCEKPGAPSKILRISYMNDRTREDFLAELEFVAYLHDGGASVANVIRTKGGMLLGEVEYNHRTLFVSLFEKAKGKLLADNNYQYRDGAPLAEYFYNCGKTLGKLHQLSKEYQPVNRRYHFSERLNAQYVNELLPDSFSALKKKMSEIFDEMEKLGREDDVYGMIHFDYGDGNYHIDFENGQITVFDFDNSCYGWYMYDLAEVWIHGTGWVMFEGDAAKRKSFMDEYFAAVLQGYRSETDLDDAVLERLPLFIQANLIENIVDSFEIKRDTGEEELDEEELNYLVKCLIDDIPYKGFFHEIYSCKTPFVWEDAEMF